MKLEEKRRKLAAAAALLEGRNADGSVSDFVLFVCFFASSPTLFCSFQHQPLSLPPLFCLSWIAACSQQQ